MENTAHHTDYLFMQRAMELAILGKGYVSPNPLVGCVIVYDNKIIGEGWHKKYGGPHAEVEAVNSVEDKALLPSSTVYVNLEPCSHLGKTPPCADMLIHERVKKVVVANLDSNPLVAGKGVEKLRAAGIVVEIGMLEKEGRELNKRFFTWMEKHRPYIMLKWAQTADGFIARENFDSKWISNDLSRQLVHKWRTEEDAVMIGRQTVQYDNPQLNVRYWTGRNPVRIIIDRFLKLDRSLNVFDGTQNMICYNTLKQEQHQNLQYRKLDPQYFFENIIKDLYELKIQSVIVEGGAQTLQQFIDRALWDEVNVFVSEKTFLKGIKAPDVKGKLIRKLTLQSDWLNTYYPE